MIEGVVAAFLMVFAFAAASALFDASLRWEAQSSNMRRAALVAEKAVGELRAWSQSTHATSAFDLGWSSRTGVRPPYAEAPGFEVEILADLPRYGQNPTTGETAPPDVYSPTSHVYVLPPAPPLGLTDDFVNPQKDPRYSTFAQARTFPKSFRRVQVIVRYADGTKEYRLTTLVGDPIAQIRPQITFNRVSGSASLSPGRAADWSATLRGSGGHQIDDVVFLWGVEPRSTGAVIIKPKDSNGRTARVWCDPHASPGGTTRLAVRCRYRGQEITEFSDPISVN